MLYAIQMCGRTSYFVVLFGCDKVIKVLRTFPSYAFKTDATRYMVFLYGSKNP